MKENGSAVSKIELPKLKGCLFYISICWWHSVSKQNNRNKMYSTILN